MPDQQVSCTQAARGPLVTPSTQDPGSESVHPSEEVPPMVMARVGKPAPDFEAMAYHEGKFKLVKLSDFNGEWRLVCFYPGDFTFV